MTNRKVLPFEQPQASDDGLVQLAAIAGVLIAALLLATAGLLVVSRTGLAAWAAFGFGALFGLTTAICAALFARLKQ